MSSKKKRNEENHIDEVVEPKKGKGKISGNKPVDQDVKNEDEVIESNIELELQQAQEKNEDYWDQIMRLKADIENNRKRSDRDIENAHKYALRNFIEALLPIVDSMEMGQVAAHAEKASLESIREGVDLIMNMFVQVLENQGLVKFDPKGETFDPDQHQAISMVEDKKAKSNTIISVVQKGFILNDRLVRPAMVVVAK
ncbi:MAG: nucleotide exchange factor GrpE [Gammaproteobacteria bacterium]|nr:MAG: nucleotide exchange factor GrpE [Gammaproteobacteria bacterium]